ncbi:MAG TPA: glycosyltransferase [Terriglobales bacterium]|nr:glycosyltransferase [Terriglobales bacterium]
MRKLARAPNPQIGNLQWFALIFCAIFLLHAPLLRLPYFWDEAGYYIPAAYEFFTSGHLIPHSVPSNAHPPLPAIYLALWWKLSAFKPAVTRTAMLLVAAFALLAVYSLARLLSSNAVAFAVLLCTSIYPVWFAQSSLAHSDLPAAALVLWGFLFYFRSLPREASVSAGANATASGVSKPLLGSLVAASVFFTLGALCKETAIVSPLALAAYDAVAAFHPDKPRERGWYMRPALLAISIVPLALWFAYHRVRTGFFFGNPEFFAYNVSGTLTPLRIAISLLLRLWQMLGYMNMWLLTLATIWAMRYPALMESDGTERRRIGLGAQYRIAAVLCANLVLFSFVGGAVLARYLLPTYPLVLLIGVSTLRRRIPEWKLGVALVIAGFVLGLFSNPFGYIPPEDNLSYRNYVILHKQAADYLQQHDPHARVLTAWTATDELTKPFLGYVHQPMQVVKIEDFSMQQIESARMAGGQYDAALLFSTKQEPSASLLDRWPWWERISRKYFGFHRDIPPEVAAEMLGGRIVWERRRGQQWAAIVSFDRVENAAVCDRGLSFCHSEPLLLR